MNDPFGRNAQMLTDALLHLDRSVGLAEANVGAAQQLGLPEAAELAARLPALTLRVREFLANVPDMGQQQRWFEARRMLDTARALDQQFAPYYMLGDRVTALKQAVAVREAAAKAAAEQAARAAAEHAARNRAAVEASRRAQQQQELQGALDNARKKLSVLRTVFADMQLQRGPGFEDQAWLDAVRSVGSMLTAQDVRLAAAASTLRGGNLDEAQAQVDQTLGELNAAMDLANRARVAASNRVQRAQGSPNSSGNTIRIPSLSGTLSTPPSLAEQQTPLVTPRSLHLPGSGPQPVLAMTLSLIEARTGTVFRSDGRPTLIGRGLDSPLVGAETYLDLSRACDPGEAEYLGISRRHAELQRQATGFVVRDLGSTNGTRLRYAGRKEWVTLLPRQWVVLHDGDTLQLGLLECTVTLN